MPPSICAGKKSASKNGAIPAFSYKQRDSRFLAEIDFDSILEEVNEKGELSEKNKGIISRNSSLRACDIRRAWKKR